MHQSSIKLEKPSKFDGKVSDLLVWKFKVREYCSSVGLLDSNQIARFAVSLFTGKALIWWMDWSSTLAGNLDYLDVDDLFDKLDEVFADVDRVRRLQHKFDTLV